jgi:hypothetical protein
MVGAHMIDETRLLTTTRDEVLQSIEFSMKFKQGEPPRAALDVAVHTLAQMVMDHLELSGFVFMRRPPASAPSVRSSPIPLTD